MYVNLQLTKGYTTLIDKACVEKVLQYTWHASVKLDGRVYAASKPNGKHVYLHRFLLEAADNILVDHINHDTLDNRIENLRMLTSVDNARNSDKIFKAGITSQYKGVRLVPSGKWTAQVFDYGRTIHLGTFDTESEAAQQYKLYVDAHWGINYTNFETDKQNDVIVTETITSSKKSSKYVGVSKRGAKFRAYITIKGRYVNLGLFETEELAYQAYLRAKQ